MTSDTPRELCWNVAFDLDLRGGRASRDARVDLVAAELALFPWMAARPGDTLRARRVFPEDFVGYLADLGLPCPRVVREPEVTRGSRLEPFGWNEAMAELSLRYERPAGHPPLDVVRRVNGRSFATRLEADLGLGLPGRIVSADVTEITEALRSLPCPTNGWVLKSEHGHAGMGMFHIPPPAAPGGVRSFLQHPVPPGPIDSTTGGVRSFPQHAAAPAPQAHDSPLRTFLDEARKTSDPLILEPWLERTLDLTLSMRVDRSGTAHDLELHESEVSRQGSFIGFWLDPTAAWRATWGRELIELAPAIASALAHEGYFGPAVIDAFVARGDRPRVAPAPPGWLRPLSDINARHSMTGPVRDFCHHHLAGRVVHWRFFSRRRLAFPATTAALRALLGDTHFDPATRTGILLTSPLHFRKIGILFAGPDRAAVESLIARFRESIR